MIGSVRDWLRRVNRWRLDRRRPGDRVASYPDWVARFDTQTPLITDALARRTSALKSRPLISVALLPGSTGWQGLADSLASLREQTWADIEVLLPRDLPEPQDADPRWRRLTGATANNLGGERSDRRSSPAVAAAEAGAAAQGRWLIALTCGDRLAPHALGLWAEAADRFPAATLIYADEDRLSASGEREAPAFKPDWNPDLLRATDYLGAAVAWRVDAIRRLGGIAPAAGQAWAYDLSLRLSESGTADDRPVHIPHLLLHRAAPTAASDPGADDDHRRAVQDHLERGALPATVEPAAPNGWRLRWQPPAHEPSVTLVVPTRNGLKLLRRCIASIFELTRYANFDLIVIDNGSDDRATLRYLDQLRRRQRVRVHRDDRPFNYAALNNAAVRMTNSEFVALVNNDIEVISPDWLAEMVGLAALPGVGAVGARLWYGNRTLQHAGVVLGIFGVAGHVHRRLPRDRTGYAGRAALLQNFSAVTAACLVVRRSHYLAVGGLDEKNLAVDYNDIDFCLRLQAAGLRNVWTPNAELFHHESASRGAKRTPQQRERHAAETAWMLRRWGPLLSQDPAYNPNLSLGGLQFSLSASPRVDLARPWFESPAPPADPT